MWGQSRCPSWRSCSAVVSARVMAVMAVLRPRVWPGSQDTSQPFHSGTCRAVWALWSLVMVVSLMVRVTAAHLRSGSWFGFQVGFGAAVAVVAGVQGVPEVGPGGREVLLDPVAGADDDHVFRGSPAPGSAAGVAVFGLFHAVTCHVLLVVHGVGAVRCQVMGGSFRGGGQTGGYRGRCRCQWR